MSTLPSSPSARQPRFAPILLCAAILSVAPELVAQAPPTGESEALRVVNAFGQAADALVIVSSVPLDAGAPYRLSSGQSPGLFPNASLSADGLELRLSGASLPSFTAFPLDAGQADAIRLLAATSTPAARTLAVRFESGGLSLGAALPLDVAHPAQTSVDGLVLEALDAAGIVVPGVSVRTVDPNAASNLSPLALSFRTPVPPGDVVPTLQVEASDPTLIVELRFSWRAAGRAVAHSLRLDPIAPLGMGQPLNAWDLHLSAPVASTSAGLPLRRLYGVGSDRLRWTVGLLPAAARFDRALWLHGAPDGAALRVLSASWQRLAADPLKPDLLDFSFDREGYRDAERTLNAALPGVGLRRARVSGHALDGESGDGALVSRGTSNGSAVATEWAVDLGTGSFTLMLSLDASEVAAASTFSAVCGTTNDDWMVFLERGANGEFAAMTGSGLPRTEIPMTWSSGGQAVHLAWVHDASARELRGYRDGVRVVTEPVTRNVNLAASHPDGFLIGARTRTSVGQAGLRLDDFRLWGRALSDPDVGRAAARRSDLGGEAPSFAAEQAALRVAIGEGVGTSSLPLFVEAAVGATQLLEIGGSPLGAPHDVWLGPGFALRAGAGAPTLADGQILSLVPTAPGVVALFGGGFQAALAESSLFFTPTFPLTLTAQGAVLDPSAAAGATLSAPLTLAVSTQPRPPSRGIVIRAAGNNSFNDELGSGFWTVSHDGREPPIIGLSLSVDPGSAAGNLEFDLDQGSMGESFILGDALAPCGGTYRLGSEREVGLVFDANNSFVGETVGSCTGGHCGFVASRPVNVGNRSYQAVSFRFEPGRFFDARFVWDMDTDRGPGTSGSDMAGVRVTVDLLDGTQRSGVLSARPGLLPTAELRL